MTKFEGKSEILIKLAPLSLVLVSFFWGATFPWAKKALLDFSPLYWLAFRFLFASILFAMIYFFRGREKLKGVKEGIILGLILGSSFILQTIGIKLSSAATMGLLTGLILPFIFLIETFIGKSKLEFKLKLSLLCAFVGFIFLSWEKGLSFHTADTIGVIASVGFAFQIYLTGRFASKCDIVSLNFYQMLVIAVMAFAGGAIFDDLSKLNFRSFTAVSSIVFTAIFCSFFAFLIQTWAQRFVSTAKTTLYFSLEPLFAAIVSWMIYYSEITVYKLIGALLMLVSVAVVQIKKKGEIAV